MSGRAALFVVVAAALLVGSCRRASGPDIEAPSMGTVTGIDSRTPRAAFAVAGIAADWLAGGTQQVLSDDGATAVVLVLRDVDAGSLDWAREDGDSPVALAGAGPVLTPADTGMVIEAGATVREVADGVGEIVHRRVKQRRVYAQATPAETWARGEGDCTEIADLAAAMLRGVGIRARVVAGVAPQGGELRWHAWVEYWDDRWATLDPTFGQHPADAGHLRLDAAPTSSGLDRLNRAAGAITVRQVSPPPAASRARP